MRPNGPGVRSPSHGVVGAPLSRGAALPLLAGALIAAARPSRADTPATPAPSVRIGTMSIDSYAIPYYAQQKGFFRSVGVDETVTTLQNGATIVQGVLTGDFDVGLGSILSLAVAIARDIPLTLIAPATLYAAKDKPVQLAVAANGSVKSPRDLNGSVIGVSTLNDLNQVSVQAWLERNGVPAASVKFVELKFPEMGQALQRGTVKAATIAEPVLTTAIRAGEVRPFADVFSAIAPEFVTSAWFTTRTWLAHNQDAAQRLTNGIFTAGRWANAHHAESGEILAQVTKFDPAVVAQMHRALYAVALDRGLYQAVLDFGTRYNLIPRPMNTAELFAT